MCYAVQPNEQVFHVCIFFMDYAGNIEYLGNGSVSNSWVDDNINILQYRRNQTISISFSQWTNDWNLFQMLFLLCMLLWIVLITFMLCEPGAKMTNQFITYSEELSRCDWYLMSTKMQQMYVVFLLDTQNPIKMLSYANITCERETSKQVILSACTMYIELDRFPICIFPFIFRWSTRHSHTLCWCDDSEYNLLLFNVIIKNAISSFFQI